MFRFAGPLRYSTDTSGRLGRTAPVDFRAPFCPGRLTVTIQGEESGEIHTLTNRRFNYHASDSAHDLLASEKWMIDCYGRFKGPLYLQRPRITGVARELTVTVISSWDPDFSVVESRYGDTYYQSSRRPPRGVNRWGRIASIHRIIDEPGEAPARAPSGDSRSPPGDNAPEPNPLN